MGTLTTATDLLQARDHILHEHTTAWHRINPQNGIYPTFQRHNASNHNPRGRWQHYTLQPPPLRVPTVPHLPTDHPLPNPPLPPLSLFLPALNPIFNFCHRCRHLRRNPPREQPTLQLWPWRRLHPRGDKRTGGIDNGIQGEEEERNWCDGPH